MPEKKRQMYDWAVAIGGVTLTVRAAGFNEEKPGFTRFYNEEGETVFLVRDIALDWAERRNPPQVLARKAS